MSTSVSANCPVDLGRICYPRPATNGACRRYLGVSTGPGRKTATSERVILVDFGEETGVTFHRPGGGSVLKPRPADQRPVQAAVPPCLVRQVLVPGHRTEYTDHHRMAIHQLTQCFRVARMADAGGHAPRSSAARSEPQPGCGSFAAPSGCGARSQAARSR